MLGEHHGYVADRVRSVKFRQAVARVINLGDDVADLDSGSGVLALLCCDGERTANEIEQLVLREHPDLFPSTQEISRFVAQVLNADTE